MCLVLHLDLLIAAQRVPVSHTIVVKLRSLYTARGKRYLKTVCAQVTSEHILDSIAAYNLKLKLLETTKEDAIQVPVRDRHRAVIAVAFVDEQDVDYKDRNWHLNKGYVQSGESKMHNLVKGIGPPGSVVDHFNTCRHDNRRANLRFVSNSLNAHNRTILQEEKNKQASSYAGVSKLASGSFSARFCKQHLGTFVVEAHAAWCYNRAVYAKYGPAGKMNNVGVPESDSRVPSRGLLPKDQVRRTNTISI